MAQVARALCCLATTSAPSAPPAASAAPSATPWQPTSRNTDSDGLARRGVSASSAAAAKKRAGTPRRAASCEHRRLVGLEVDRGDAGDGVRARGRRRQASRRTSAIASPGSAPRSQPTPTRQATADDRRSVDRVAARSSRVGDDERRSSRPSVANGSAAARQPAAVAGLRHRAAPAAPASSAAMTGFASSGLASASPAAARRARRRSGVAGGGDRGDAAERCGDARAPARWRRDGRRAAARRARRPRRRRPPAAPRACRRAAAPGCGSGCRRRRCRRSARLAANSARRCVGGVVERHIGRADTAAQPVHPRTRASAALQPRRPAPRRRPLDTRDRTPKSRHDAAPRRPCDQDHREIGRRAVAHSSASGSMRCVGQRRVLDQQGTAAADPALSSTRPHPRQMPADLHDRRRRCQWPRRARQRHRPAAAPGARSATSLRADERRARLAAQAVSEDTPGTT